MSRINNPEKSLPYYLRGAFRGFETALGRYLKTFNLPVSQFYILRLQWDEAGNSQIDIAERAFMTESVTSQVLKKMDFAMFANSVSRCTFLRGLHNSIFPSFTHLHFLLSASAPLGVRPRARPILFGY